MQFPGVTELQVDGVAYTFQFEADERAAAELLKSLVERGIPVVSFGAVRTSLEDVYLRSGVKQVD
jgi:hypothetical protein